MHVDACLGGFLIVFMEDLGYKLPPFDFRNGLQSLHIIYHYKRNVNVDINNSLPGLKVSLASLQIVTR